MECVIANQIAIKADEPECDECKECLSGMTEGKCDNKKCKGESDE